jgi:hypothetical protein
MNWFKKKEKNKLLVSTNPSSSNLVGKDYDIKQIIEKASSNLPKWWTTSKFPSITPKEVFKTIDLGRDPSDLLNAKTCPSFINIFSNSYVLKCPADLYIKTEGEHYEYYSLNNEILSVSSHPLSQMNNHLKGEYFNLKFNFHINLKTLTSPLQFIFLSPIYFNSFPFNVMPGVLDILPDFAGNMALNCLAKVDQKTQYFHFPKGEILGVLYCTTPLPPIEQREFLASIRETIQSSFLNKKIKGKAKKK